MKEPTEKERHWFLKVDSVLNKEELDKLVSEVEKEAVDFKAQILQKAELKKKIMGWE
jgi:hypothetical protein